MEWTWPLKLQYTWLSGYLPLVRLRTFTSTALFAAGMSPVLPQKSSGGVVLPGPYTWNSHRE